MVSKLPLAGYILVTFIFLLDLCISYGTIYWYYQDQDVSGGNTKIKIGLWRHCTEVTSSGSTTENCYWLWDDNFAIDKIYGEPGRMFAPFIFKDKVEGGRDGLPFLPGVSEVGHEGPKQMANTEEAGPKLPEKPENPFQTSDTGSGRFSLPWLTPESLTNQQLSETAPIDKINSLPDKEPPQHTAPHGKPEPHPGPDTPVSHHIGHPGPEQKPNHEKPADHKANNLEPHSEGSHQMEHSGPDRGQDFRPHHGKPHSNPGFQFPDHMGRPEQHGNQEQRPHHEMPYHHMPGPRPHPNPLYHQNTGPMRPAGEHGDLQRPIMQHQKPENRPHMQNFMSGPQNHPRFSYPDHIDPNMISNARPYYHMQNINGGGLHHDVYPFVKEYNFFHPGNEMGENHPGPIYPMRDPYESMQFWGKPLMYGQKKPMDKPPMPMVNMLKKVLNGKFKVVANMIRLEAYPIDEKNYFPDFITGIPEPREEMKYLPQMFPPLPGNGMPQSMLNPMLPLMPRPSKPMVSVPENKLTLESLLQDYKAMLESTHHKPTPLYETLLKDYQKMLDSSHIATTLPATTPTVPTTAAVATTTELASTTTSVESTTTPPPIETTTNTTE
ncbi:hypothetical protein FSP39_020022 [Pinctada imbricata]|uniref:Uncharacterized protein n=1 Tax=Pinctada imbricata TaxID=66713 RepID=A0AA88Y7M9_PINIB|nr:hypothetical protein FSP39_020022 [Pinctada imbricata]